MPSKVTADKPGEYISAPPPDLHDAAEAVKGGHRLAVDALADCLGAADAPANARTFLRRFDEEAAAVAQAVDRMQAAGQPLPRLAGLAVSVKDLFDVAGHPTTAGSRVLAGGAPASTDAACVARLRRAGAAFIGHTNMTEFAFSGVGINPHFGTPPNPATRALDDVPRIPGGSTSGGAVSVATGAAWAALGSDTGGSIRIPAALQGLVGFKNTARLTPLDGATPLSPTLDTACAITRSVRDAILIHEILAARSVALTRRPLREWRLAVPLTLMLDGVDGDVAAAFERALDTLRNGGARIDDIALPELTELAGMQAAGGFAAVESWAWHRDRLSANGSGYDPRVAARIRRGEAISAADERELHRARSDWIARMEARLTPWDALLSPTVPLVAPAMQPLIDSDDAFFATNALLLRNPSVVNMLDGCALSLPCHGERTPPVGMMVWGPALRDDAILDVSLAVEAALGQAQR